MIHVIAMRYAYVYVGNAHEKKYITKLIIILNS